MRRGRVTKSSLRVRRSRRLAVLKMLSAGGSTSGGGASGGTSPMTAENAIHDFLTTGRTGRRNAMPDILGEHAKESTGDLPERLEGLTCSEGVTPGTSGTSAKAETSQESTSLATEGAASKTPATSGSS